MRADNKYLQMLRSKGISFNRLCHALSCTDIACSPYVLAKIFNLAEDGKPLTDKQKAVIKFAEEYVKETPEPTRPSGNDFLDKTRSAGINIFTLYRIYDERYGTHLDFPEWVRVISTPLLVSDYRVAVKVDGLLNEFIERKAV